MSNFLKLNLIIILSFIFTIKLSMAYEQPTYKIIKSTDFEIRKYKDRLAVETDYSKDNSGFRDLFKYISGANSTSEKVTMTIPVTQSLKIDMTAPITQTKKNDIMVMQFFLPANFTLENAPKPTNEKVRLVIIGEGYYAVLKYSGRLTDKNYLKHYRKLLIYLKNDSIEFLEPAIRATYNGPLTLPFLRRNEVMIKILFDEKK